MTFQVRRRSPNGFVDGVERPRSVRREFQLNTERAEILRRAEIAENRGEVNDALSQRREIPFFNPADFIFQVKIRDLIYRVKHVDFGKDVRVIDNVRRIVVNRDEIRTDAVDDFPWRQKSPTWKPCPPKPEPPC